MALHHMLRAEAGSAGPSDPYFEYNTLLLTGNGTNGAQNNTFLDSSSNNFTITRNGNTTQGTFSPYGNLWSNYFDGVSDYLSIADNAAFDLGTGDFTIEAWVYHTTTSGALQVYYSHQTNGLALYRNVSGYLEAAQDGVAALVTSSTVVPSNQWVHVAASRSGTSLKLFINGVQDGSATNSTSLSSSNSVYIGSEASSTYEFTGYLSNLRLVKGTALYTSSFTPSTTPLTAVSGTSLLTCQSNRFIDNSSNNFTLTVNGNTSVQRFSPFNPTAPYDSATIGGSGYFDGSGDYLNLNGQSNFAFGTGDFTVECFVYRLNNSCMLYDSRPSGTNGAYLAFAIDSSNRLELFYSGVSLSAGTINANEWTHIAISRSGTSLKGFINGTQVGSTITDSTNLLNGASRPVIGVNAFTPQNYFNGYISNLRVVKGTAVYTSNFAPPTAPLTAITNTQLLCNLTNAGIPDAAMQNDLETVGNAQVSTSVKKYGTGSLYFDGSGDGLFVPPSPNLVLGTGDFTIEFWTYILGLNESPNYNNYGSFVDFRTANSDQINVLLAFAGGSAPTLRVGSSNVIVGSNISLNTWTHLVLCRSSGVTKMFMNGTQVGNTYTDTNNYANSTLYVGINAPGFRTYLYGYIDDLRITKGYARYTSNFTPPTAALPTY